MPTRPFIEVVGTFKVQLIYSYWGQRIENVFNVKSGGGVLVADADRIESVFASWWTATGRAQVSANCTLLNIILDALNSSTGLHKEYVSGFTGVGLIGGSSDPGNVTTSVKLSTGVRGRSFRGRIYWPAITESQRAGNQLNSAAQAAIQTAVNTLRTSLAAGTPSDRLVVVSYRTGGVWRASGVATEVTACSTHVNLDSMRRRLTGRGL